MDLVNAPALLKPLRINLSIALLPARDPTAGSKHCSAGY
ncbi:hypothetical protein BSU04_34325 [Caballeronia sordidicola]|uniref:Uncharacterized protein n=1 Tax=Caballeronia sordidicola TaxID=196367 RepID=A0A226WSZ6_CABSO|nr:hypothetical protein BSU04_34325 [Caballeronia sordidicola]